MSLWAWIPSISEGRIVSPIPDDVLGLLGNGVDDDHIVVTSVTSDGCFVDSELFGINHMYVAIEDGFLKIINLN